MSLINCGKYIFVWDMFVNGSVRIDLPLLWSTNNKRTESIHVFVFGIWIGTIGLVLSE